MQPIESYIDYTALKLGTLPATIDALCEAAIAQNYAAVCVPPYFAPRAIRLLRGHPVACCTVIGFPHGQHLPDAKLAEASELAKIGVQEMDMVANLSALRSHDWDTLRTEIAGFQELCAAWRVTSKVIIESGLLEMDEVKAICDICIDVDVDFVKTSTGFAGVGAELDKVEYMRQLLPPHIQIKASGGIRDYASARAFVAAGATRIGTSTLIVEP